MCPSFLLTTYKRTFQGVHKVGPLPTVLEVDASSKLLTASQRGDGMNSP